MLRSLLLPITLCALLAGALNVSAQDDKDQRSDADPMLEKIDNPLGRAEYERIRRADPATGKIPEGIRARELNFVARIPSREQFAAGHTDGKSARPAAGTGILWNERGPVNQGGRTRAIAVDLDDESVLLAGAVSGGMWRSEDTGTTWTRVTDIGTMQSVTCVVQDSRPGTRNVWYYGTGEYRANSANLSGDGIFKSVDGGKSWSRLESTVRNTPQSRDQMFDNVHRIVLDPTNLNQDVVYAACYGGIVRSVDGGESWDVVLGSLENRASYTDIDIAGDGVLYATLSSNGQNVEGIWRSEDGVNWTDITPQNFPASYGKLSVGIAPSNKNLVYVFGYTLGAGKGNNSLWVYEHGKGWEDRSTGLPSNVETYSSYCVVVRVHPQNEDLVLLGHVRLHRSIDGFRDSNNVTSHMGSGQHADQHEYVFFPSNPDVVLAGHDGGISLTSDITANNVRWTSLNNGYSTTQFYAIAIDHVTEDSWQVIGGTQDNGSWYVNHLEDHASWNKIFGADGGFCAIADGGTSFYTSYQNGQIFRSQFEGTTREAWARVDPENGKSYMFIHPFTLDRSDSRIMYLPEGYRVWRNSNLEEIELDNSTNKKSTNWEILENTEIPSASGVITAIATSQENPSHRVYFGTSFGNLYRMDDANDGEPEVQALTGNGIPRGTVSSIAVDPHDGNRILVALSNYNLLSIFYSEDGGQSWDSVAGNLEEFPDGKGNGPSVSWVEILPLENGRIYFAGTTTGLYSTTFLDGANTVWVQEGKDVIGNVVVDMVRAREVDGFVAVGTHGRGVFTAHVLESFQEALVEVNPVTVNFGEVEIGATRYDTVSLTNNAASERELNGTVGTLNPPFAVEGDNPVIRLAPGETKRVVVSFSPEEEGNVSEALQISHNGTSPQPQPSVWVLGKGIPKSTVGVDDDSPGSGHKPEFSSYPNPIHRRAVLRFALETAGNIRLTVLDAKGNEVAVVFDGALEAGQHESVWIPDEQPSGVYYVRMRSDSQQTTIPVVLER